MTSAFDVKEFTVVFFTGRTHELTKLRMSLLKTHLQTFLCKELWLIHKVKPQILIQSVALHSFLSIHSDLPWGAQQDSSCTLP